MAAAPNYVVFIILRIVMAMGLGGGQNGPLTLGESGFKIQPMHATRNLSASVNRLRPFVNVYAASSDNEKKTLPESLGKFQRLGARFT